MPKVVGFPAALLCVFARLVATTCYFPNGDFATTHSPCDPDANNSVCCETGYECLSNGFCNDVRYDNFERLMRGGCTDEKWEDKACSNICLDIWPQGDQLVSYCGKDQWCCDSTQKCCDDPDAQKFTRAAPQVAATAFSTTFKPGRHSSTIPVSSSTSTITAPAASATSQRTSSSSNNNTLAIGLGVGVGVGVSLIILSIVACIYLRRRKRRKAAMVHELEAESTAVERPTDTRDGTMGKYGKKKKKGSGPGVELNGVKYHEMSAVGPTRELEGDTPPMGSVASPMGSVASPVSALSRDGKRDDWGA